MTMEAIILGCGSSSAVPGIGNYWGACDPNEPKNRRTRTSLAIKMDQKCIVIDTGPDFKEQFDRENLPYPDAVFYTHGHADHITGADELRWLVEGSKTPINIYSNIDTIEEIKRRFYYLFDPPRSDLYRQILSTTHWKESDFYKCHSVSNIDFDLLPLDHESVQSCGFRFGDFAYTTDLVRIEKKALESLRGIKTWVVDTGAYKNPNNMAHACLDDVYQWNEIVGAEYVYFTAMPPQMDYQIVLDETPDGYAPAYDGLSLIINI